jgi:hypothetical protein
MDLIIWWIENFLYDSTIFDILVRSIHPKIGNVHYVLEHMDKNPWKYNPNFYSHFFDRVKMGVNVDNIHPFYLKPNKLFGNIFSAIKINTQRTVNMQYVLEICDMDYVVERYSYIAKAFLWYIYNMSVVMNTEKGHETNDVLNKDRFPIEFITNISPYLNLKIAQGYIVLLFNLSYEDYIDKYSWGESRFIRVLADEWNKFTYPWSKFSVIKTVLFSPQLEWKQ